MNSVLVTDSGIDRKSGGGLVSHHLLLALAGVSRVVLASGRHFKPNPQTKGTPFKTLLQTDYRELPTTGHAFLFDYFALRNLREVSEPVHLAQFYGNPFGLAAAHLKERGAKLVVDVAPHLSQESRTEWQRLFNRPWPFDADPFWPLYSEHHRLADAVVVHSRASAAYLAEKSGLGREPVVIPHGCEVEAHPAPLPEDFRVGHLSQFGPDKGQSYLLVAWQKVAAGSLAIAGAGSEQLKPLARHLGLDRIEFSGWVASSREFLAACSVYVQPSITEGFGIPVLEAMALGRPVIVAAGAGVAELVTEGEDGFVVPVRDAAALAGRMEFFRQNPAALERMGHRARETAQKYTWDKIRLRYQELYRTLTA